MKPKLEILSQGDELITGQISGTNAAWLSQRLTEMGCNVTRHLTVGDKLEDLTDGLLDVAKRADCCISTGGLGPTTDDLTAEAVAQALHRPLVFDEIAFGQITSFFKARNRAMPECNRKQAMLPDGSMRLDNRYGTAPGFAIEIGKCLFFFLPGVPAEMKQMFLEIVKPILENRYHLTPDRLITIKTIGIGESDLQERLSSITIPLRIKLGFRASVDEVETKLLCPADYPRADIEKLVYSITAAIGDAVIGVEGMDKDKVDLISIIDRLMKEKSYCLSVVETVSRGLLTAKLAQSECLITSLYEHSLVKLACKLKIDYEPVYFEKMAKLIAEKILIDSGASMVLLQLLKPDSQANINNEKPITVVNVILTGKQFILTRVDISGTPERKQQQAMLRALDFLRRLLQGKTLQVN